MSAPGLRILQMLTHHRIASGGAFQAYLLSRELARRGHSVTVAVYERKGETDPETRERIASIDCEYTGVRLRGRVSAVADIRRLLRDGAFDVVHLHREGALMRFLQAAPLCPPVGAVANVGTSKPPSRSQAARLRSTRLDRVVVVAEALKRLLVRAADVEPTKIEVVYGAYDETRFRADAEPYDRAELLGVPGDARLVGMVANIDKKKGHEHFLKAAAVVAKRDPRCHFVCAGKGDREWLRDRAREVGLDVQRLHAIGFHDDVPRLLKTLDVSVSASTHGEGLTGAVRESLAMGTPVVSTAVAGNVEVVRHDDTGLLVPPGDDDALAGAILRCLDDPESARRRAQSGLALVHGRLTSAARAEHMERIYRDVVRWREVRRAPIERILFPSFDDSSRAGDAAGR